MSQLALTNVTVIAGPGTPPAHSVTVLVRGTQIVRIGRDIAIPTGTETYDLAGQYMTTYGFTGFHATSRPAC
jgi:dihydroorotase-like cyclic amidohydrolase